MLHFFNGQRRDGDIQHAIDTLLDRQGLQLPVLVPSIDITNGTLGDLSNSSTVAFWLDTVKNRKTLLVIGGPPCESWTAARYLQLFHPDGTPRKGPRPIRFDNCLWGIKQLTPSEIRSIQLGNLLLRVMLLFMHAAKLYGIGAIMEHPQFPSWIDSGSRPASSSLLPEMVDLLRHDEVEQVSFDQGTLGAPSVKPTTLTVVNVPQIRAAVMNKPNHARCTARQRKALDTFGGLDSEGKFTTAASKQYPAQMCSLIAGASVEYLFTLIADRIGEAPNWESFVGSAAYQFYMPLDLYLGKHQWGMFGSDCAASHGQGGQPPSQFEAEDSLCMQPAPDFTVLASFAGPPPITLTAEQRHRISVNRDLAVQRQKAKRLREVRAFPVRHVQSDHQEESSQQVMPLLPTTHLTSSHRRRFAFGAVTPSAARRFLSTQLGEAAGAQGSHSSAVVSPASAGVELDYFSSGAKVKRTALP